MLRTEGHDLIVFKNLHRLNRALQGEADVDADIEIQNQKQALNFIQKEGWIAAINPAIPDPEILHYYFFDISEKQPTICIYI